MKPNNNKKKIIIALCCIFAIALLTIPFLGKDNQIPKKINNQINKKEISNDFETPKVPNQEVSSKKTFLFFIIIGIVAIVVVILIISLIIFFIKKRNNKDFLSKGCYFVCTSDEIKIYFGLEKIDYLGNESFYDTDIYRKQQKFYQDLQNNENIIYLRVALTTFYKRITDFLFQIDGHLLKACYDPSNQRDIPLAQMSKNFNEKTLVNQTLHDEIAKIEKIDATRPLSENEKQLLNSKNYVDLFKTIMQQDTIPYYEEQNEKLPLFEHCHTTYTIIKKLYSTELPRFFNTEGNKKYLDKYKNNIDNAMNEIKKCLEIKQAEENPSTQSFFLI